MALPTPPSERVTLFGPPRSVDGTITLDGDAGQMRELLELMSPAARGAAVLARVDREGAKQLRLDERSE